MKLNRRRKHVICAILPFMFLMDVHFLAAAEPYRVPLVVGEIDVDGRLDEPFWESLL